MNQQSSDIINAIQGTAAQTPTTTMSTGIMGADMPASPNSGGLGANPGPVTPNYMNTVQGVMGGNQPYNPLAQQQPYNPMIRHGIGRDSWSSNMGLDQTAILNSLGLGGQT